MSSHDCTEFVDRHGECIICTPPCLELRGRDRSVAELREWAEGADAAAQSAIDRTAVLFDRLRRELAHP